MAGPAPVAKEEEDNAADPPAAALVVAVVAAIALIVGVVLVLPPRRGGAVNPEFFLWGAALAACGGGVLLVLVLKYPVLRQQIASSSRRGSPKQRTLSRTFTSTKDRDIVWTQTSTDAPDLSGLPPDVQKEVEAAMAKAMAGGATNASGAKTRVVTVETVRGKGGKVTKTVTTVGDGGLSDPALPTDFEALLREARAGGGKKGIFKEQTSLTFYDPKDHAASMLGVHIENEVTTFTVAGQAVASPADVPLATVAMVVRTLAAPVAWNQELAREAAMRTLQWIAPVMDAAQREQAVHALAAMEASSDGDKRESIRAAIKFLGGPPEGRAPPAPLPPPGEFKVAHLAHDAGPDGGAPPPANP